MTKNSMKDRTKDNTEKKIVYYLLLIFAIGAIGLITFKIVYKQAFLLCDYSIHMHIAQNFWDPSPENRSYPMWHFLTWLTYNYTGIPIEIACAIVSSIVNVLILVIVYLYYKEEEIVVPQLVALATLFVSGVFFPPYNSSVYARQGSPNAWHNPTNLMTKPFTILAFWITVHILENVRKGEKPNAKDYLVMVMVVFLSVLAKPSFFQGFVPALGIYMIIAFLFSKKKEEALKYYFLLCLTFVPGFCLVLKQFLSSFGESKGGNEVAIGWGVTSSAPNAYITLLMLVCFPLAYTVCNIKNIYNKTDIQLAWLFTVASWVESMALYETGDRMHDGNFTWAVELSYFVLFLATSRHFFKDLPELKDNKKSVLYFCLGILWMWHLFSGIYYVFQLITIEGMWM